MACCLGRQEDWVATRRTTGRKTRRLRTIKPPARNSLTAAQHGGTSAGNLKTKNARLTRALREALEQQTVTSEVLKVISRSEFELQPVLESLVENAVRLCGADRGFIFRQDGEVYRVAASYGHSPEFLDVAKRYPIHNDRTSATGRAVRERRVVHIPDILADPEYRWAEDHRGEEEMHRTILAVPMLREGAIIGVIVIRRIRVQPFTEMQIALVTTFADQAVIAIENVRLFDEAQARTRELTETLKYQTATSAVLSVISSSPTHIQPVFDTIVENVVQLGDGVSGFVYRYDDDLIHLVAHDHSVGPDALAVFRQVYPLKPSRTSVIAEAILDRAVIHVRDFKGDPDISSASREMARAVGHRSLLAVPMLREGEPIGAIAVGRRELHGAARPFSDQDIDLLKTFADQAVIAIENVRLFEEVQARSGS